MTEPTAAQLAKFDQAYANTSQVLQSLISTYRHMVDERCERYEVTVVGLSQYLAENGTVEILGQLLATALHQMSNHHQETGATAPIPPGEH